MNLGKIEAIIGALRQERYRWTPVRRTYIEKKGTKKKRPLGLPTWSDKLLQEVIRLLHELPKFRKPNVASSGVMPMPLSRTITASMPSKVFSSYSTVTSVASASRLFQMSSAMPIFGERRKEARWSSPTTTEIV